MRKSITYISLCLIILLLSVGTLAVILHKSGTYDLLTRQIYTCPHESEYSFNIPITAKQVEKIVGFNHPELAKVFQDYVRPIYSVEIQCAQISGKSYIAISLGFSENILLIYELDNSEADLIFWTFRYYRGLLLNFGDRNLNGLVDFAYTSPDPTNGRCPTVSNDFYYIEYDNVNWVNLLPDEPSIHYATRYEFYDLGIDGIADIASLSYYLIPNVLSQTTDMFQFMPCGRRYLYKFYSWNGEAYTLSGVQIKDTNIDGTRRTYNVHPEDYKADAGYYPSLEQFVKDSDCDAIISIDTKIRIFDTLLYHYGWNRLDGGWSAIQPIIDKASMCENTVIEDVDFFETIESYQEYFASLLDE